MWMSYVNVSQWFDTVREKNAVVTHDILKVQAERLATKLGHDDFTGK